MIHVLYIVNIPPPPPPPPPPPVQIVALLRSLHGRTIYRRQLVEFDEKFLSSDKYDKNLAKMCVCVWLDYRCHEQQT